MGWIDRPTTEIGDTGLEEFCRAAPIDPGWRSERVPVYPGRVSDPTAPYVIIVGPPALDASAARGAGWKRAMTRRELAGAAGIVVMGPLTANARPEEARPLRSALAVYRERVFMMAAPADLPSQGRAPGWLTGLTGDTIPPRRIRLGSPRATLITLDTLRIDGGRDAIGVSQLAALETELAARPAHARTLLALVHDPRKRRREGPRLVDSKALGEVLRRHPVELVIHGQSTSWDKGRFAGVRTLAAPPLSGCAITGWRVVLKVSLPQGEEPTVEPIHIAPPLDRPALAEAFAAADVARAWTGLAERVVEADDTFAALAEAMGQQTRRFEQMTQHGAELDDALAALIRRAGEEEDA